MAKQAGIIRLIGTVGNITFQKTPNGYLARDKAFVTKERIESDPSFQRTRENNAEFKNAAAGNKLLRTSITNLLQNSKDRLLVARLVKAMLAVVKGDTTSMRGERTVATGDISLLENFDFNSNAELTTVFAQPYTTTVNRVAGTLGVTVPVFTPVNDLVAPEGTTHFSIVSAGAEVDFAGGVFVSAYSSSDVLPWNGTATTEISLNNAVTAASTSPLFLMLGIQFFQQVNGVNYSLKNGKYNPLTVVAVNVS